MNNEQILNDFRRRYESTYVGLKLQKENREVLAHIDVINYHPSKIGILEITTEEFGKLSLNLGSSGHSLIFHYPKTGVFQYGREACIFTREPRRQYKRGLCPDNSNLVNTTVRVFGNLIPFRFAAIAAAFKHQTYTLPQALAMLQNGTARSVALENDFSISLSLTRDKKTYLLWYCTTIIGECDSQGTLLNVFEPIYKQQLEQLIYRM